MTVLFAYPCSQLPETMEGYMQQAVQASGYWRPVSVQLHSRCLILDFCMLIAAKTVNITEHYTFEHFTSMSEIVHVVRMCHLPKCTIASNDVILMVQFEK